MKHLGILSILLTILFSATYYAQNVQVGLRLEKNSVAINKDSRISSEIPVSGIEFGFNCILYDSFALDLRYAGELDSDFYKGSEYGVLGRYYYKDFYAVGGILNHSINSNGHGLSTDAIVQSITLPAVGIAYNPEGLLNRHLVFEILYINGLNKIVGWSNYSTNNKDIKLKYVIKIGLGYSYNF